MAQMTDILLESTVLVELQGLMETNFLEQVKVARMLGIEASKPLLQLDDYTFTGEFSDTVGTAMMFDVKPSDNPGSSSEVPGDKQESELDLHCIANKKWTVRRVFLKNNQDKKTDSEGVGAVTETIQVENDVSNNISPEEINESSEHFKSQSTDEKSDQSESAKSQAIDQSTSNQTAASTEDTSKPSSSTDKVGT
ncbi:general transcription factor 3C polypeptide 6-like isoform X3 [Mya arenaria]|uniref:general transcription factor 3C polypeptide 6-like isoform X3 n=1 Tax=Mya arenaria TaxID=6604 RepID=UPI0022E97861|nr:general transcription factor 3C polypeptide 6-like isoform X3 [Mya arenaria]